MRISVCKLLFFAAVLLLGLSGGATPATAKTLAITPFTVNAAEDLTYLSRGAADMLASRIAAQTDVSVLDMALVGAEAVKMPAPLTRASAADLGRRLGADHVLFGSITVLGGQVSMDVNVVDVADPGKSPAAFYRQADSIATVIPAVGAMAGDIRASVFAAKPLGDAAVTTAAVPPAPDVVPAPVVVPSSPAIVPATPPAAPGQPSPESPGASAFVMSRPADQTQAFWKSQDFDARILGLAVADVDGDKKMETVLLTDRLLTVRRLEQGRFFKLAEHSLAPQEKPLSVDAVDTDANGKAEIFVSCINTTTGALASFVLELSDRALTKIAEKQGWYFRSIGGAVYGQKKGVSMADIFLPGIYRLARQGDQYVAGEPLSLPGSDRSPLFSLATGNVTNSGATQVIAFDGEDHLRIYDTTGEVVWKSEEPFGGSETHITTREDSDNEIGQRFYLAQRIWVGDINGDGRTEVLTVANNAITGRLFDRFRQYSGARFVCLSWDGLGLSEVWHTQPVSGYASDFGLADVDNDGKPELVAAIVSARGAVVTRPRSSVISYDLEGAR
ncbi:MAG: FG-GAP-like repeat-containing protein [Thermodesulfobacteriota bacterium]